MNLSDYIAEDGGGKLHKGDERAPFVGHLKTTNNENPILFLCYMARASFDTHDRQTRGYFFDCFNRHTDLTRIGRGRYSRRPGDANLIRQSHDNLIAIAWGGIFIGTPWPIFDVVSFLRWRFWNYNIVKKWYPFDLRCQILGKDVFVLKLAAGLKPGWLSTLWFCAACIVSDHAAGPYLLYMLRIDIVEARISLLSRWKRRLVETVIGIHVKRREGLHRWYKEYFNEDPNHPAVLATTPHQE